MFGEWSGQSPSMRVVITVPEHDGGLDSSRARWWSGQSPSTRIVATVPEHKDSHDSPQARKVWQKTICLKRLKAGYPKEVDPDKAEELRMTQLDLSAKIILANSHSVGVDKINTFTAR